MYIVAGTGHRPNRLGGYSDSAPLNLLVIDRLIVFLQRCKDIYGTELKVVSGLALGVDTWWGESALKLQIPVIGAMPFRGQELRWPIESQQRYRRLVAACQEVVVCSPGGYSAAKMQTRNQWMVDHCQELLAVWNGTPGGTANCVEYAEKLGRQIFRVNPAELS